MKLILAIINHDDANTVTQALTKKGFSSTKLATTGGFLMAGNVTIGYYPSMPVEVVVGGATIFVVDIERFERV